MTYQTFSRLALAALDCTSLDGYIAECGGSMPEEYDGDVERTVGALTYIYNYAHVPTAATLLKASGLTQAAFARAHRMPLRTLENWLAETRECPAYIMELLAYAVLSRLEHPDDV